jgi:hypothetical protein
MEEFQEVQSRRDKQVGNRGGMKYVPRGGAKQHDSDVDMKEPGQKNTRPRREKRGGAPKQPEQAATIPTPATNGAAA